MLQKSFLVTGLSDFPSGKCVSLMKFPAPVASLSISASGEYYCVSLTSEVGVSVLVDNSLFSSTPFKVETASSSKFHSESLSSQRFEDSNFIKLSTLSKLQFTSLFYFESLRRRNSPMTQVIAAAPFFMSSKLPLTKLSQTAKPNFFGNDDVFITTYLVLAHSNLSFQLVCDIMFQKLMESSSTKIDIALEQLCSNCTTLFGREVLFTFLLCLIQQITKNQNFEFMQALLFRLLIHAERNLVKNGTKYIADVLSQLLFQFSAIEINLERVLDANICILRFLTSDLEL